MLINKFISCLLSLFLFQYVSESFGQIICHYNDTTLQINNGIVQLKNTYVKKKLFLRTTVVLINTGDDFMLLDPNDVFLSDTRGDSAAGFYDDVVVVPPHSSKRFYLKFNAKFFESPKLLFDFSKINISQSIIRTYMLGELQRNKLEAGSLSIDKVDEKKFPEMHTVRIKVRYEGTNLLAINFNNIGMKARNQGVSCYNLKKPGGRINFNPNIKKEVFTLVFSNACERSLRSEKVLTFNNVFTEYSLRQTEGFKIWLNLLPDNASYDPDEKEIELIE